MARLWGPNCPVLPTTYGARGPPPASEVGRPQEIGDDASEPRLEQVQASRLPSAITMTSLWRRGLPLTQTLQT